MNHLEPHPGNVSINKVPGNQIEDLIKLLVTIHHRFGNTTVKYALSWGANALWAADRQAKEIKRLKKQVTRLKATIEGLG